MSDASYNEQLLMALVDGELQGEERARAEKLLSENPEYEMLIQRWQQSTAGFRALPRYRLNKDFSTGVLQKISQTQGPVQTQQQTSSVLTTHWRTGFAAIATLAAMLLLTLFVFPNAGQHQPVAIRLKESADKEVATEPQAAPLSLKQKATQDIDELIAAKSKNGNSKFSDESFGRDERPLGEMNRLKKDAMSAESDVAEFRSSRKHSAKPSAAFRNKSQIAQGEMEEGAPSPTDQISRSHRDYAEEQLAAQKGAGQNAFGVTMSDENDRVLADQMNVELADEFQQLPGNSAQPKLDLTEQELAKKIQPIATQQILLVDIDNRDQPLQIIKEVLVRNSIQVIDDLDSSVSGSKAAPAIPYGRFGNQSPVGVEALSVVSTATQMRQAILELSSQAKVSGYQVPQFQQVDPAMQPDIAQSNAPALAPNQERQDFENKTSMKSPYSSARRLQSYELAGKDYRHSQSNIDSFDNTNEAIDDQDGSMVQRGGFGKRGLSESDFDKNESRPVQRAEEKKAEEIAEVDRWFGLGDAKTDPEELIQYLLLVRTSPEPTVEAESRFAPAESGAEQADRTLETGQ